MNKTLPVRFFLCLLFVSVSLCAQAGPASSNYKIYIGFLDDAREEMVNWKPGVATQRVIRPAFEKTDLGWREVQLSTLPNRMKWTVAFDGRSLGLVESETDPDPELTAEQTILTSAAAVPSVGSPSIEFAGLLADPTRMRRPLVTVSKPYFQDPDGWKRTKLPTEIAGLIREAFRREYPHIDRCKDEEVVERNWRFPESALAIPVAYASNKHSFLVETRLNSGNCGYVDNPEDPSSNPWFLVLPDGVVRRIGSFMSLLDAGDYDNDGKSELVFFASQGENTDGFLLYDADLTKRASLIWHYH